MSRERLEVAVHEMIDTVDHYFDVAAFEFIFGGATDLASYFPRHDADYDGSRFEGWKRRWMGILGPDFPILEKQ
jgi:hypothetical protein